MKDLEVIQWDLRNGYIPQQFNYRSPQNDRDIFIKHFPAGFMNLPNANKIIDRMMFYAKLKLVLSKKYNISSI
jgi:hypothetical protein